MSDRGSWLRSTIGGKEVLAVLPEAQAHSTGHARGNKHCVDLDKKSQRSACNCQAQHCPCTYARSLSGCFSRRLHVSLPLTESHGGAQGISIGSGSLVSVPSLS